MFFWLENVKEQMGHSEHTHPAGTDLLNNAVSPSVRPMAGRIVHWLQGIPPAARGQILMSCNLQLGDRVTNRCDVGH
jgi:hypothetical protein